MLRNLHGVHGLWHRLRNERSVFQVPARALATQGQSLDDYPKIEIPKEKLEMRYARSSGPGGQNVNKVNTKVELRFHVIDADWLAADVKSRLIQQEKNRINKLGELIVSSDASRTQKDNMKNALAKMHEIVNEAAIPPKIRKQWEGLSDQGKKRRVHEKRIHSHKKESRRNRGRDD